MELYECVCKYVTVNCWMLSVVGLWPGTCSGSYDDWVRDYAMVPCTRSHTQLRVLHSGWSV